jgi:hypothetical protein
LATIRALDYRSKFWWAGKHVPLFSNVGATPCTKYRVWNEIKDTFISCEALTAINHELKTFKKKIAISDIGKYLQK